MKTKQYYGKELSDLIKKYEPKPVSANLINRIPSQNVVGAFVMNYPPEGFKAFLTLAGFDGLINGFLGKYISNLNELTAACKGEVLFAATDLQVKTQTQNFGGTSYSSSKPDIKMLFALSLNNKASFDKLINIAQSQLMAEGGQQALSMVNFKTNNDWFAISNSAETVDGFLAGRNNSVSFADKISGHPFGMYVDIQKLLKSAQPMATEAASLSAFDASLKLWQDVVATGGEYKDGACVMDFAVNLIDKKNNSLKQLNHYFEQLAALKKKEVADVNEAIQPPAVDSAVTGQ